VKYRNYTIEKSEYAQYDWCHDDYDGPPNPRCGLAKSVEDAKQQIDDLEDWIADGWWPEESSWQLPFAENH
jgi:hypothetical protein